MWLLAELWLLGATALKKTGQAFIPEVLVFPTGLKPTDWKLPDQLGTIHSQLISLNSDSQRVGGQNWQQPPRLANNFRIHEGPFKHYMDSKLGKRLAGRKERRCRFGDINVHKCCQFGKICSPFQALATPEMRRLMLPRDLPINPRMEYLGFSCTLDPGLQDFYLSSKDLNTEEDSDNETEKPVTQMKTPLFPPMVKTVKSSDIK
ncbi:uncharacterized protein LOC114051178 [Vombatus ursinus]|uniref:uncharacterized protein LOC114051178 n=1 Tax=Vombatus ursinus TaxID=29139 RepID=UPI000FFDB0E8|nr:uncharacterized protein LOC114051178 [Vombatus ursinus]